MYQVSLYNVNSSMNLGDPSSFKTVQTGGEELLIVIVGETNQDKKPSSARILSEGELSESNQGVRCSGPTISLSSTTLLWLANLVQMVKSQNSSYFINKGEHFAQIIDIIPKLGWGFPISRALGGINFKVKSSQGCLNIAIFLIQPQISIDIGIVCYQSS